MSDARSNLTQVCSAGTIDLTHILIASMTMHCGVRIPSATRSTKPTVLQGNDGRCPVIV